MSKARDFAPSGALTESEGRDRKHTEAPLSNGDRSIDELKLAKRERKAAKAAKKAQRSSKKAAKEAKLEKNSRETQVLDNTPVNGERVADPDTHEVIYFNTLFAKRLGGR